MTNQAVKRRQTGEITRKAQFKKVKSYSDYVLDNKEMTDEEKQSSIYANRGTSSGYTCRVGI